MIENEAPGPYPDPDPAPPRPRRTSWFLWLVIFSGGTLFLLTAAFYALFRSMGPATPSLSSGTALSIDLSRPYPEDPLYDMSGPFVEVNEITFRELLFAVRTAKEDARIEKLFLHVRGTGLGWANMFELHRQLLDFKTSGKAIVAFVEYAGNRDYFLASAAGRIYLHPRGMIDLRGVRAELMFVKSALDKLGVEAEFERFGDYKDAPDMFLRENMSEASREAIGEVVDTLHETMVTAIAEGRGIDPPAVNALIAAGPFTAEQAKEHRLVNELLYEDEVRAKLAEEGEEPKTMTVANYHQASRRSSFSVDGRIALIYGVGAIVGGANREDSVFGRVMGSDTIGNAFKAVREDDSIDAVIFRIDSPGGSDVASDVIWREAQLTREKKPVIVSMANVAASGGYWIAMASDAILAEPTTITGSIGIYAGKFNLSGLYEKIGVSRDGVSSAPNADFFSDSRRFTPRERKQFRAIIESGYQAFLERVAEARGKTTAEVHAVAQGRVWTGRSALEHGLIDELGGLERAIAIAKEKIDLEPTDRVALVIYPEKKNIFEALLSGFIQTREVLELPARALLPQELLRRSPLLRALASGQPLAMMPYELTLN